jgi:hypothetical protein
MNGEELRERERRDGGTEIEENKGGKRERERGEKNIVYERKKEIWRKRR